MTPSESQAEQDHASSDRRQNSDQGAFHTGAAASEQFWASDGSQPPSHGGMMGALLGEKK